MRGSQQDEGEARSRAGGGAHICVGSPKEGLPPTESPRSWLWCRGRINATLPFRLPTTGRIYAAPTSPRQFPAMVGENPFSGLLHRSRTAPTGEERADEKEHTRTGTGACPYGVISTPYLGIRISPEIEAKSLQPAMTMDFLSSSSKSSSISVTPEGPPANRPSTRPRPDVTPLAP